MCDLNYHECNVHREIRSIFWQTYEQFDVSNIRKKPIIWNGIDAISYIRSVSNYIKDNILKKYPDLNKIYIDISEKEDGNNYHNFAVSMMGNVINYDKLIFVVIYYDGKIVYMTVLDFNKFI